MANLAKKQARAAKCQKICLWLNYIICTLLAAVSFICCGFQIEYTENIKLGDGEKVHYFDSVVNQINDWYSTTGTMSASLLGVLSAGLIASYVVLIHTICKYFKSQL